MEGILAIWHRDVLRFFRDKPRVFGSLAMPFMFLVLFGSGMSGAMRSMMGAADMSGPLADFDFVQFMFPGIIGMTVFNTAVFSALSVVQDKEFGYMREILVSPVSRTSIAIGKVLGGSTVAVLQGLLMLIFVPLIGVTMNVPIIIRLIPAMFLVAFAFSSIGLLIASTLKSSQGFQIVIQMLIFPMLFLSGAFFPLSGMPAWMDVLVKINPLTYGVGMLKKIVLQSHTMDPILQQAMGLNLTVFNRTITLLDEVILMLIFSLIFIALATIGFHRSEAK